MRLTPAAEERLRNTPCSACHKANLTLEYRLEVKPIGSFSLAGAQMKVSAVEWPWVVCPACGRESKGTLTQ